jgi:hypothetical protein
VDSTLERRHLIRTRLTLLAVVPIAAALGYLAFAAPYGPAPWLGSAAAIVLAAVLLGRSPTGGRRPARSRIDGGSFAAGPDPVHSWTAAAGLLFLVMLAAEFGSAAWHPRGSGAAAVLVSGIFNAALAAIAVVGLGYAVALAVSVWSDRSVLRLTPDGIQRRVIVSSVSVPWDAIAVPRPVATRPAGARVPLTVSRPELVRGRWRRGRWIWLTGNVDPAFLLRAIRWYVEHPADRPAIGTEEELARLAARWAD